MVLISPLTKEGLIGPFSPLRMPRIYSLGFGTAISAARETVPQVRAASIELPLSWGQYLRQPLCTQPPMRNAERHSDASTSPQSRWDSHVRPPANYHAPLPGPWSFRSSTTIAVPWPVLTGSCRIQGNVAAAVPLGAWRLEGDGWSLAAPNGAAIALIKSERLLQQMLMERPGRMVRREAL